MTDIKWIDTAEEENEICKQLENSQASVVVRETYSFDEEGEGKFKLIMCKLVNSAPAGKEVKIFDDVEMAMSAGEEWFINNMNWRDNQKRNTR